MTAYKSRFEIVRRNAAKWLLNANVWISLALHLSQEECLGQSGSSRTLMYFRRSQGKYRAARGSTYNYFRTLREPADENQTTPCPADRRGFSTDLPPRPSRIVGWPFKRTASIRLPSSCFQRLYMSRFKVLKAFCK